MAQASREARSTVRDQSALRHEQSSPPVEASRDSLSGRRCPHGAESSRGKNPRDEESQVERFEGFHLTGGNFTPE